MRISDWSSDVCSSDLHERRIVSNRTLDRLAVLMRDGAELRMATDDMGYLRWMLDHTLVHPAFEWTDSRPGDWGERPADWPPPRYEEQANAPGRKPAYMSFFARPHSKQNRRNENPTP